MKGLDISTDTNTPRSSRRLLRCRRMWWAGFSLENGATGMRATSLSDSNALLHVVTTIKGGQVVFEKK